jgi:hypothetical protein
MSEMFKSVDRSMWLQRKIHHYFCSCTINKSVRWMRRNERKRIIYSTTVRTKTNTTQIQPIKSQYIPTSLWYFQ